MNEEQKRELDDYLSGNTVKPPHGSVFDDISGSAGPPMVRMIMLQIAFSFIAGLKMFTPKTKAILIGCFCAFLAYYDMSTFIQNRNHNLYNILGIDRLSTPEFIDERLGMAKICDSEATEEACSSFMPEVKNRLNQTEIAQVRFAFVQKPQYKELYDKNEIFIRPRVEKTMHNPSQGSRYLSAFKDLGSFSIFLIVMAFYVEKYQNFCRQVVISSLLIFAAVAFQLKVPKEGDDENQVVWLCNKIPMLRSFTLFEISHILRSIIYPCIFQAALHMSRMIDIDPKVSIRNRLQETQKRVSRSLILCELITNAENTKPAKLELQPEEDQDPLSVLNNYGKSDPHILAVYEMVCIWRKTDTVDYMAGRFRDQQQKQASKSYFARFGWVIKNLFVFGIVLILVGPHIQQIYKQQVGTHEKTMQSINVPKTQEDITKAAMQREDRQSQRQKEQLQEFEDLYTGTDHDPRDDL